MLDTLVADGGEPGAIVEAEGLGAMGGGDELDGVVQAALDANPDIAERLKGGNMKPIGVIIGHVMRETQGPRRRRRGHAARAREARPVGEQTRPRAPGRP